MDKDRAKTTSIDSVIEAVKQLRINRIQSLLNTKDLMIFLEENYTTFAISPVRLEFLKRDLNLLLQSPLDLVHYSSALRQIKDSQPVANDFLSLIDQEVRQVIEKYGFGKA